MEHAQGNYKRTIRILIACMYDYIISYVDGLRIYLSTVLEILFVTHDLQNVSSGPYFEVTDDR